MPVTTFELDEPTMQAVRDLQETFGVRTNAAVLRKAIALAKVAASQATSERTVTISGAEGKRPLTVTLAA